MESNFSDSENAEFICLLKKIQENSYWIPSLEAWQEVQRTFSRWALELVITDTDIAGKPRILLSRYSGEGVPEHANLFHIAGGFDKFPESIQETCSRVARDELGVDVEYQGVLGLHKWSNDEHPWGSRLLSLYAKCVPKGTLETFEGRRFFTRSELLVLDTSDVYYHHPHRAFADAYLQKIEAGISVEPLTLGL